MKTEGGAHITTISQGVISNFYLLGKEEPVSSNVSSLVRRPCFSGRPQPRVSGQSKGHWWVRRGGEVHSVRWAGNGGGSDEGWRRGGEYD